MTHVTSLQSCHKKIMVCHDVCHDHSCHVSRVGQLGGSELLRRRGEVSGEAITPQQSHSTTALIQQHHRSSTPVNCSRGTRELPAAGLSRWSAPVTGPGILNMGWVMDTVLKSIPAIRVLFKDIYKYSSSLDTGHQSPDMRDLRYPK